VSLDEVDQFPVNETRLKTFDNPLPSGVGRHDSPDRGLTSATLVRTRRERIDSWSSPSTALIWAVPCRGFLSLACSCAPATEASTMRMAIARRGRLPRTVFAARGRVQQGRLEVQAPHYPTLQDTLVKGDV